ncbi:hypothetical protein PIROE2DRAFT_16857 [Piromyces sp. E2]|nr:hypothetical protein PIROE2DRAFT_16857 [Piromyces sp. E2]|eukprot:OUM57994.1 hypothetical protein PIROE2DRAFT_16857 [Piromyces sp. E2]
MTSFSSFIQNIVNQYGGEELFQLVQGTLYTTPEKYQVCRLIKEGNTQILHSFVTNNKISLKDLNFNESRRFYNSFYSEMDYSFDLLVFAIECKAPLDTIKYIVEQTPYNNLNYGIKSNIYKFRVPLFHAIVNNDFKVANYLINKGANLKYEYECPICKVDEPCDYGRLRYCGITDENMELDWILSIKANVVNYIREFKSVNEENLKYLEYHGFSFKPSEKEEMIREANRDERKELAEMLRKTYLKS